MRTVEFLQYTLQPSTGNEFHQIMRSVSVPLHQAAGIDVVTYGQSQHDPAVSYTHLTLPTKA